MMLVVGTGAADEMLVWLGHFDRFALSQPDTYGLATLAPLIAAVAMSGSSIIVVANALRLRNSAR